MKGIVVTIVTAILTICFAKIAQFKDGGSFGVLRCTVTVSNNLVHITKPGAGRFHEIAFVHDGGVCVCMHPQEHSYKWSSPQ